MKPTKLRNTLAGPKPKIRGNRLAKIQRAEYRGQFGARRSPVPELPRASFWLQGTDSKSRSPSIIEEEKEWEEGWVMSQPNIEEVMRIETKEDSPMERDEEEEEKEEFKELPYSNLEIDRKISDAAYELEDKIANEVKDWCLKYFETFSDDISKVTEQGEQNFEVLEKLDSRMMELEKKVAEFEERGPDSVLARIHDIKDELARIGGRDSVMIELFARLKMVENRHGDLMSRIDDLETKLNVMEIEDKETRLSLSKDRWNILSIEDKVKILEAQVRRIEGEDVWRIAGLETRISALEK